MTNVFLFASRLVEEYCKWEGTAGQYNPHARIVILSFGVKKSGFHKDEVRSPRGFIGNNNNGEVSIQECPRLFRPGITIVISV